MPFDKTAFDIPKADVLSAWSIAEWLRSQDLDTEYDYGCTGDCLLHRFLVFKGMNMEEGYGVGGMTWSEKSDDTIYNIPWSVSNIAVKHPYTYRAALERAEAYLEKE